MITINLIRIEEMKKTKNSRRMTAQFLAGHRRHPDHINIILEDDMAVITIPDLEMKETHPLCGGADGAKAYINFYAGVSS